MRMCSTRICSLSSSPDDTKFDVCGTSGVVLPLPMSRFEVPIPGTSFFPMRRNPPFSMALADPASFYPQVLATVPLPVSGGPDVAASWRGHGDHAHRWRRDPYFDHATVPARRRVGGRRGGAADERCAEECDQQGGTYSHTVKTHCRRVG